MSRAARDLQWGRQFDMPGLEDARISIFQFLDVKRFPKNSIRIKVQYTTEISGGIPNNYNTLG